LLLNNTDDPGCATSTTSFSNTGSRIAIKQLNAYFALSTAEALRMPVLLKAKGR